VEENEVTNAVQAYSGVGAPAEGREKRIAHRSRQGEFGSYLRGTVRNYS